MESILYIRTVQKPNWKIVKAKSIPLILIFLAWYR